MQYIENESVSATALADLRESVGWNRIYDKFGFFHMLSGQIQTFECE